MLPYKKLDDVLKCLEKNNGYPDFISVLKYLEEEKSDVQFGELSSILDKLQADGYIEFRKDILANGVTVYLIKYEGILFNADGGYEKKKAIDTTLLDLDSEKKWYDTENAKRQFDNFGFTKTIAWVGAICGVFALLLKLAEVFGWLQ